MDDEPILIEEIEPVFWNGGVTGRVEPNGSIAVEVVAPDPQPLTPHPPIPSY